MNQLKLENGGRPAANDDFQTLQALPFALGLPALLTDLEPCVVSGCRVYKTGSIYNVGPGVVWDGANLLDFPGQSNVTLPAMFAPGAIQTADSRPYQDGTTKTTITSQVMELVAVVAGAPNLVVDTYGALSFWHRAQAQTRSKDSVEWLASVATSDYDAAGLGKPGTSAWGWGLCDGQGGRADLRGRFVAGLDASRADYDTPGKTGGAEEVALSIAEMPSHHHGVEGYNAINNNMGATLRKGDRDNGGLNFSTTDTGGGQGHENRPPYYVLAARQWVAF